MGYKSGLRLAVLGAMGLGLGGCAGKQGAEPATAASATSTAVSAGAAASAEDPGVTADGVEPAKLQVEAKFDAAQGQLPESLVMDREGALYLTMGNRIMKLNGEGKVVQHAALPIPEQAYALGLELGPDGCIYAVSGGFGAEPPAAFVFRVCEAEQVEQVAALDPHGFPNDLAFDGEGRLYVTEPFLGRIYRIGDGGEVEVWFAEPALMMGKPEAPALPAHFFGVDGIVAAPANDGFYVGNLDKGYIIRIPINQDGTPGAGDIVAEDGALRGVDGLWVDSDGTVYAAVNAQDQLVAVSPEGTVTVLAKGAPLDAPSALIPNQSPQTASDVQELYVTSFAINRAVLKGPEQPQPALLKVTLPQKD